LFDIVDHQAFDLADVSTVLVLDRPASDVFVEARDGLVGIAQFFSVGTLSAPSPWTVVFTFMNVTS
jgi:hypothetical protein